VRVRLKGINRVRKRLADGREVTYWYAWKSGPKLQGEPGSPEFVASFNEAHSAKVALPAGVLLTLLSAFEETKALYSISSGAFWRTVIQASKHWSLDHALRSDRLRVERH
jgi:hypothetical protein